MEKHSSLFVGIGIRRLPWQAFPVSSIFVNKAGAYIEGGEQLGGTLAAIIIQSWEGL